jgi:flavin-dependent thymidylate synthase
MNNEVKLIGHYGGDITHAQSAWTSTDRELNEDKIERIPSVLKMLADNGHHTPFEKSTIHFLVTCDQASHIHLLKHRIGVSINAESARYKELKEDKMYLPEDWKHEKVNRNDIFLNNRDLHWWLHLTDNKNSDWNHLLQEYATLGNLLYHQCIQDLTPTLGRKRAKESARFFKMMNSQITMDISFNFRSFAHFCNLRNAKDAQLEIREIAESMLNEVMHIEGNPFKETINAFNLINS